MYLMQRRNYSLSLYQLLPRVKLTDLLMEVSEWTGFEKQFLHASTLQPPKEEENLQSWPQLWLWGQT